MSESKDAMFAQATMGTRIEEFLHSEVGRFLVALAQGQERDGVEELLLAKDGTPESAEARTKIALARMFGNWLADGINAGIAATHNLRQEEEYDLGDDQ